MQGPEYQCGAEEPGWVFRFPGNQATPLDPVLLFEYWFVAKDALEQSLYQCGIAGREALHKYWRCSVIGTNQYLERECEKLSVG